MLNLHAVWSIATPIALVEAMSPRYRESPWLGRFGYGIAWLLFLFGVAATAVMSYRHDHFTAGALQFTTAAAVIAALCVAALKIPRERPVSIGRRIPSPWIVGAAALAAGSAVRLAPASWGWWAAAAVLGVDCAMASAVLWWSRSDLWTQVHSFALAGGAAFAYGCMAFIQPPLGGVTTIARIGNGIFLAGALLLLWLAARRVSTRPTSSIQSLP